MSNGNVREDVEPSYMEDPNTALGRNAKNTDERRAALRWCINNVWATARIGRLERIDEDDWHGWAMWRWKKVTS